MPRAAVLSVGQDEGSEQTVRGIDWSCRMAEEGGEGHSSGVRGRAWYGEGG